MNFLLGPKYCWYFPFSGVITYHAIFFHSEGHGKLTVFSVKAMLATMCGGKILDKLRCKYFHANQTIYEVRYFHDWPRVLLY